MSTRFDVTSPRKKPDGGTFWHRIGTAFPAKEGEGMNVILDSLPLPDSDGRVSFIIRPAKDMRDPVNSAPRRQSPQAPVPDFDGDAVPF